MSSSNNSELYNRSGASFYTLPEWDPETLLKENEDLKSEISLLESSFHTDPKYWTFSELLSWE